METVRRGPVPINKKPNRRPVQPFRRRLVFENLGMRIFQFYHTPLDEQPFLMTIPTEVRLRILKFLLTDRKRIDHEKANPRNVSLGNWSRDSTFSDLINISLTCKRLFIDARDVFYKNNTFHFKIIPPESLLTSAPLLPMIPPGREFQRKKDRMNKVALTMMGPRDWQERRDWSFHHARWAFREAAKQGAAINTYKNERRACGLETVRELESIDLVLNIPNAFPLCPYHLWYHKEKHSAIINPRIGARTIIDLPHETLGCRWYPQSHWYNLEPTSDWYFLEEAKEWAQELSKHVDWTIAWDIFEFKRDMTIPESSRPIECAWFRLQFCLAFHKIFDKGEKYENRRAWLLSLGGSDPESL